MASDNQTVIVGNLVDDPELRFTNNGTPVSNLRVAVTQRVLEDGAWRDEVLLPTRMGRMAVACYDRCSPRMVRWLEHRPRTRAWVRRGLDALVRRIA